MRVASQETLRALMKQRNFSMARLARYAGCSKSFIHQLCDGTKKTCTAQLGARIAEALEVPVEILFVVEQSADSGRNVCDRRTHGTKSPDAVTV
ncbi:helix-turn-helix transcriptional regulator [Nocardia sp. CC201C]|uniref:helix-turn-helix domain-containing protein n=1 Tax=Nocardia sp. CC201C TaxID=3044575 RepID=UPI0024A96F88|nr:helix-turn-helix transcriptional regulator [Nocardia sp. CC201C]